MRGMSECRCVGQERNILEVERVVLAVMEAVLHRLEAHLQLGILPLQLHNDGVQELHLNSDNTGTSSFRL